MNPLAFLRALWRSTVSPEERRPSLYRPSWAGPGWAPAPPHFTTVRRGQRPILPSHINVEHGYGTPERCAEALADLVRVECGWCGREQWHWTHSEGIGIGKKYGIAGAYSGDSSCTWCGRGIYEWWRPWTAYFEWADDAGCGEYAPGQRGSRLKMGWSSGPGQDFEPPVREWRRNASGSVESTVFTMIEERPHPCAGGQHVATWGFSGWSDVPGALVHWTCGLCNAYRHWGREADGPNGPAYPAPSIEQEAEWAAIGRANHERERAAMEARIAVDVDGECNERWAGGKCGRHPGHEGSHGQEIAPGVVLAPFDTVAP